MEDPNRRAVTFSANARDVGHFLFLLEVCRRIHPYLRMTVRTTPAMFNELVGCMVL